MVTAATDLADRLRGAFPDQLAPIPDPLLTETTARDIAHAAQLEIDAPEEVWRYVCLRYTLRPERMSAYHLAIARSILHRMEWSARDRLDYFDTHRFYQAN